MLSRLKSLELQGYKTFANRTVFEFPGAVTAIVGPNGSGKSNITDALRWVLGEQSYSLLRGKKTEDMIFSGSDRRTRSGMATATVILDNSDSWLPIDYGEVAIARRAYRDGSNEYLLNGQRVRLKDVSELLAESGLAERTYTIIGQGLVDAALALRAEDRRRLFEEAAGIGLHRTRRQEALRRLEDTRRNMERVEDILIELRPRLRSLERQARRAQEYEAAVSELRDILREWYGYHWHRAQEELSGAQKLSAEKGSLLEDTRQKDQELDSQINLLRKKRGEVRELLTSFHHQSAELHSEREKTSRDLAVSEERARNLQIQEQRMLAEFTQVREDASGLEERHRFAGEEVTRISSEYKEAEERLAAVKAAYEERQEQRTGIEGGLAELRKELVELSSQQENLKSRRAEIRVQIDTLTKSMKNAVQKSQQTRVEVEHSETRLKDLSLKIEQADTDQFDLETRLAGIQTDLAEKNTRLIELSKKLAEYEAELAKITAQLKVLQQAERSYAGYSDGAKLLLTAVKDLQIDGSQGILGSRIKVPKQYEVAIGAALGDYVDALVLENEVDVDKALNLLERQAGKAAILPLGSMLPGSTPGIYSEHKSIHGRGDELVDAPADLKPAVEILLGRTLVVGDRKEALKVLESLRTNSPQEKLATVQIVTLSGEVFQAAGPIRTSSEFSPVSLSRPREQDEFNAQLEETRDAATSIQSEVAALEEEIQLVKEKQDQVQGELVELQQIKEKMAGAHREESALQGQLARDLGWWEEQASLFEKEILDNEESATRIDQELDESLLKVNQVQDKADQYQARLRELPVENLQADLSHWSTRVEILKLTLDEAESRLSERKQALAEVSTKGSSIQEAMKDMQSSQSALDEQIQNLKQSNLEIAKKLEANRLLIAPAEDELDEIEGQLAQLLKLESNERLLISQAEQNFTQARIAQIRKQEALDGLRRQIEVDFGLVAFEYRDDVSGPTPLPLEGFVEDLPMREEISPQLEQSLTQQRALLRRIGPINPEAQSEYKEISERYSFLTSQVDDLQKASEDVQQVIAELDEIMQREFCNTFEAVADEFHLIFGRLFGGGSAQLILTDPNDLTNTGIDIEARLPGKREQGLSLLSGGERSLTAVALVFSLLRVSPTPFCVLDEVDAMLDEANVGRFRELLRELSQTTQFIMITHNRATVQVADIIYGVTMGRDSTSKILSLKVDELEKVIS